MGQPAKVHTHTHTRRHAVWLLQPVAQSGLYQPSIYLSIYLSIHIATAGTSADNLQNMACDQELANRIWAGRDVEMSITA